ncbi:hypothetical protein M231_04608 [Tremella mesenterica]|uniref:Uncharacterized protein n=1 Tax=Tremella mesenterica TaxID=5217 RepID=A0A4V1M3V1_TREME|nr:hypothetical protein M231_04608 [Tremella mesenterica]
MSYQTSGIASSSFSSVPAFCPSPWPRTSSEKSRDPSPTLFSSSSLPPPPKEDIVPGTEIFWVVLQIEGICPPVAKRMLERDPSLIGSMMSSAKFRKIFFPALDQMMEDLECEEVWDLVILLYGDEESSDGKLWTDEEVQNWLERD